jgi:hypothetical protein
MPLEQSYTSRGGGSASTNQADIAPSGEYWALAKLRKCYTDYLFSKREELDEQIDARRYYHGSQYTAEQVKILKLRKQPIMTFNRVGRKIDGVVGLIERLRQDPKAYPRTPKHEEGADLATAAVRYVLDEQEWKAKSPECARDGAIDGIGGIELELTQGDQGDPEIGFLQVDIQSFFYDPRSYRADFSDARYMGVGKWVDEDVAQEMFQDAPPNAFSSDDELVGGSDRESRWFSTDGVATRVRLVEIWYQHKGGWCYAIFSGNAVLAEGKSYLQDEKGKDFCKYIMFSGNVDQDGDRYGFVRNMKSAQDGINAKQSKMQHILASKRIILSQGAVADVEKVRAEWARPDGVVITNRNVNEGVKLDDQSFDFVGVGKLLELNLSEIESYGPNPQLVGEAAGAKSGRAIALLQQGGLAELGPYILAYRGWKVRVYRAIMNAIQRHWTAERWIRVTDDEGLAQFVQINGVQIDPQTGMPTMVNAIGSLDVDIILDEAPDSVNMQAENLEYLQALGPQFALQYPDIAIELSPIDSRIKRRIKEKMQEPNPGQQAELAKSAAETEQKQADAGLKEAQTIKTMVEAQVAPLQAMMDGQPGPMQPQEYEVPAELQNAEVMANIEDKAASAEHKRAQAFKTAQDARLAPQQMLLDHENAAEDRKIAEQQARQRARAPA